MFIEHSLCQVLRWGPQDTLGSRAPKKFNLVQGEEDRGVKAAASAKTFGERMGDIWQARSESILEGVSLDRRGFPKMERMRVERWDSTGRALERQEAALGLSKGVLEGRAGLGWAEGLG